jgi:hypothetical protein
MQEKIAEKYSWIEGTNKLRDEVLNDLTDADLAFTLGGNTLSFGALCKEMGEVELSYTNGFKTFKQDFSERADDAHSSSISAIKAWWASLDADLKATLDALTDSDLEKTIDRGFPIDILTQIDIYLQALLIFLGKATVYLRALNKPFSQKMVDWIG